MSAALRSGLKSLQDQLSRTQRSLGEREAELSQLKERVTNEYQGESPFPGCHSDTRRALSFGGS